MVSLIWYSNSALQECKALHFPASAVEMPNTDALPYLMYKSVRGALTDLRLCLDETLDRELSRISDKGASNSNAIALRNVM